VGHVVGKDLYRRLGRKIDGLVVRAPWNETLYEILKELYTADEAEVVIKMPYGLAKFEQIARATGFENTRLRRILDALSAKGLVMDLYINGAFHYMLSPLIVGIFEFTMMRTRGELNTREWARLFHSYLGDKDTFYKANLAGGQRVSPLRALPYEDAIEDLERVEILDYEKASAIVEQADEFAIGLCSCRHEKLHADAKKCSIPLETCSTIGDSAAYMIERGFARAASKTEMLENIARSRESNMVLCADNVKNNVSFICHCCSCCCNVLLGVSRFGYPNAVVTSSFIARRDEELCTQCEVCAEVCPIKAIKPVKGRSPQIDESFCLGCGVCALNCQTGAMRLAKRPQKVLHPLDTFERVILQCLERGNLQNLLFSDTERLTHKFMRGFVGAFLRIPPVKKSLMSDTLRSSFLDFMRKGA
jgi:Pyruvate/2-oxoacid:ferredoxin oxidoreductase delta subunit